MSNNKQTFVEKILGAPVGSIVFKKPDLVLTHDNSASIKGTFEKMGGQKVANPDQLLMVLDHNAPPTNAKLATQYQTIRDFASEQSVNKFHDVGDGICHQIMADHARPGMIIVGSDSHTCTAGAFNALAAGIDRTEAAGIWRRGETWFRVPETIKINLSGKLPEGVYAKDLSLYIIGMIGSAGANYMSIEYHGEGVKTLDISERMTIANLASEMGGKNAVFPPDEVLEKWMGQKIANGFWADEGANYTREINIDLSGLYPLTAAPHNVDNVKTIAEVKGKSIQQALIGTCTNGRIEDLRIAANILRGKKVPADVQLLIAPASKKIYLQAIKEGLISDFIEAGANVLGASCGPCLGTGQGIPADDYTVISTANRNFKGRMGNKNAEIYLASPAAVALSALNGEITDPRDKPGNEKFPYPKAEGNTIEIQPGDNRHINGVWNYADADNLNTDQMFAGNLTYNIMSSDPEAIMEHLFAGFDENFAKNVQEGDIIVAGENFGCGSSREHPAVGLAHAGVKAVIVKSVNRIFYRSCINQGLLLIVNKDIVEQYSPGDQIEANLADGKVTVGDNTFDIPPLPEKLMEIIKKKGLVNWIKNQA
ncbi:MAG TPA: aconitase/3-isopropylmalate dehydratase large subunit family protein [Salinivirga sp.]|uniref:aconitase/3-isopropylmalate dehydratase large subunit family protein n=1 Tax=Salinivirga sp. TaxID=1970192 RepID=UPI002B45AC53|nr:aconitase/3-isopropylmalate dehydratase large subunit family protein [Salinivirga sp.]HKK59921.1 aconitase/3-isopropylmalate dehydratase large subunit family protein [Salinivirga sp.]